eukprot:4725589-Alexandrium_andersonii.AAC.1
MSASLVGSEMCIRDSTCTFAHAQRRARAWTSKRTSAQVHRLVIVQRHGAVSYTHLDAADDM